MHGQMEFFTATCLNWNHLLSTDDRKNIIINSLRFVVNDGRMLVYGFVIMPNHVHILWVKQPQWEDKNVEHSFLKYTAQPTPAGARMPQSRGGVAVLVPVL